MGGPYSWGLMQVIILANDGDAPEVIGCEAMAIWPEGIEMTEDRIARVAERWEGGTLNPSQVMEIVGN